MRTFGPTRHARGRYPALVRTTRSDRGQTALIMVVGLTVLLALTGGFIVTTVVNTAPIITNASIQRYAYRALASGLNVYQSAINADPYLAACNSDTNDPGGSIPNPQCAGLSYETWSEVPGTNVGNGVIPEFYKFDNPQQIENATTKAISYIEVQIVGAAGFSGKTVSYSTVAKFTPSNDFLNNVWWSNYESFDSAVGGSANDCAYYWANSANYPANGPYPNRGIISTNGPNAYIVPNTPCTAVDFETGDQLFGPVYTNDSIYIDGTPTFSSTVNTADPECLFVNYTQSGCATDPNYTTTGSGYDHAREPLPTDDSELAAVAQQGGCYYQGPTQITLSVTQVAGVNVGQMKVVSPDTTGYPGNDTMNAAAPVGDANCPTDATAALPSNGVLFVGQASSGANSVNPFYSATAGLSQVQSACSNCYYGQTPHPGTEADAFVNGTLSGHLTVAAYNNVIVDGSITYDDCTWASTPSQSQCAYNNATTASGINDTLGLIANNFIEVNRPIYNSSASPSNQGNTLPTCNGTTWVPPLCDPSTSTGSGDGTQGLTIDGSVLALNQSFAVNNYSVGGNEGTLDIYGSIQQDARGAVGQSGGYVKYYYYDPRLTLYGPPFYLTPGTPSWSLESSSESYTGTCPVMPPPQQKPFVSPNVPTWPWPNPPTVDPSATPGPANPAGAGSNCINAP
jgi:hypothetical protein